MIMHNDLEAALDAAFEALKRGDIAGVCATYAVTESILTDLRVTDAAVGRRLQSKAERNAACLLAAGRGVRAAMRRLQEIGPNARSETYDARGRKSALGTGNHGLAERL
jgi:hypothetical protein